MDTENFPGSGCFDASLPTQLCTVLKVPEEFSATVGYGMENKKLCGLVRYRPKLNASHGTWLIMRLWLVLFSELTVRHSCASVAAMKLSKPAEEESANYFEPYASGSKNCLSAYPILQESSEQSARLMRFAKAVSHTRARHECYGNYLLLVY